MQLTKNLIAAETRRVSNLPPNPQSRRITTLGGVPRPAARLLNRDLGTLPRNQPGDGYRNLLHIFSAIRLRSAPAKN